LKVLAPVASSRWFPVSSDYPEAQTFNGVRLVAFYCG